MNEITLLEKIEEFVSVGKFDEALKVSLAMKNLSGTIRSDLIHLSGRYHDLRHDKRDGILDIQGEKLIQNQIMRSFLELIRETKQDNLKDQEKVVDILYKIGNKILHSENYHIAIQYFDKVIESVGVNYELLINALNDRGISKSSSGDLAGAKKDFDEALKIQPENKFSLFNRGMVYLRLAEKDFKYSDFLGYEPAKEFCNIFIHP